MTLLVYEYKMDLDTAVAVPIDLMIGAMTKRHADSSFDLDDYETM